MSATHCQAWLTLGNNRPQLKRSNAALCCGVLILPHLRPKSAHGCFEPHRSASSHRHGPVNVSGSKLCKTNQALSTRLLHELVGCEAMDTQFLRQSIIYHAASTLSIMQVFDLAFPRFRHASSTPPACGLATHMHGNARCHRFWLPEILARRSQNPPGLDLARAVIRKETHGCFLPSKN